MRGRYDPIKRFAAFRKTYELALQSKACERGRRRKMREEMGAEFDLRERIRELRMNGAS